MALKVSVWGFALAILIFFLTLPTGTTAQLALATCVLLFLLALYQIGASPFVRQSFIIFSLAVIIKYVYWRVTSTIPPVEPFADFAAAMLVLIAELYCVVMLFISVFVMINPLRSRPLPQTKGEDLPTVDVFVPSYNEDPALVAYTLSAAKKLEYDPARLNVYLLDDGGTEEKCNHDDPEVAEAALNRRATLMALCEELGVHYRARSRNVMAKAGNLNFGLEQSSGDLVVVFDADHAPVSNFLKETVPHFHDDPRLFLVQTPHRFVNADPIERNLGVAGYAPSENEMFYGSIQHGLDSWNSSFFCGSAAVLRRTALEEVNGFAGVSITEDCETALALHGNHWNSRYVDKPMVWGLQPESFAGFIGQRSRWCRGMLQILLLKTPMLSRGLSIKQRLCYASSSLFWFFPLARMVFLTAPLLYILFDMKIYAASAEEFVAYTIPYLAAAILMQGFLFGRYRWPWMSELYEYVQSVYLIRAVASVIMRPRKPKFNVTDKGRSLSQSVLSPLAWPYFLLFAVLLGAMVYAIVRYQAEPASQTLLLVVGGWNLFNLVLAGLALGCVSERAERQSQARMAVKRRATMMVNDRAIPTIIEDVSQGGLRLRPVGDGVLPAMAIGTMFDVVLEPNARGGEALGVTVELRHRSTADEAPFIGTAFKADDNRRFPFVATLMYAADSKAQPVATYAPRRRNLIIWTGEFLVRSAHQTMRGLGYALLRSRRRPVGPTTPGAAH